MADEPQKVTETSGFLILLGLLAAAALLGLGAAAAVLGPKLLGARKGTAEAQDELLALYESELAYRASHGHFTADLSQLDHVVPRGNRYAYFASVGGPVLAREPGRPEPSPLPSFEILGADLPPGPDAPLAYPPTCNLSNGTPDGPPGGTGTVSLGVSGASQELLVLAAVANLDKDRTWDCWSIASLARFSSARYELTAPGEPIHDSNDLEK